MNNQTEEEKLINFWRGAIDLYAQRTAPEFQIQINNKGGNKKLKWITNKN